MKNVPYRFYLTEEQTPKAWYNLRAAMKDKPEPMLNPATLSPVTPEDLQPVFCDELVRQELDDTTECFPIPQPILDMYRIYRPSPLIRAYNLEKALDTPAKIYYKFEGNNTSGSHKLNSALAQAYYAKAQGLTSLPGNRRGEDDPVRPDRHGVLRHECLRQLSRRNHDRPYPHGRGIAGDLRQAAEGGMKQKRLRRWNVPVGGAF